MAQGNLKRNHDHQFGVYPVVARTFTKADGTAGAALSLAVVAIASVLYFTNRKDTALAEKMMEDAARLELNVSGLSDVRAFAARYHGRLTASRHDKPCVESDCLTVTTVPMEEFPERHPKLSNWYNQLLGRAWQYSIFMWVKNGKLVARQQWFTYMTRKRSFAVIAETGPPSQALLRAPSYGLHPGFTANFAPHHFNIWLDPNAHDYDRLLRLHVGCAKTLAGCKAVSDVAPTAWQHYEADQRALQPQPAKQR